MIGVCLGTRSYMDTIENRIMVEKGLRDLIKLGVTEFYSGGIGSFEKSCARYIKDLKQEFPFIKSYLILAYYNPQISKEDEKEIQLKYDGTIYPPLENVPLRFAISKRNKWMVDIADCILFYVNNHYTNSFKFLEYAHKRKKMYVNLGSELLE